MSNLGADEVAAQLESNRDHRFARASVWLLLRPALLLMLLASGALCLGLLVYMADRRAADVLLMPRIAEVHTGPIFGSAAQWLPSFVHPFAFSLLSAAVMSGPAVSARVACSSCALWWVLNLAFEVGQHPRFSTQIADFLQLGFGKNGLTAVVSQYLLRGHFDWGDIWAVSAGALAAAVVLRLLFVNGDCHES